MPRKLFLLFTICFIGKIITVAGQVPNKQALITVPSVDLNRYTGTWYEIARLPNRFETDCTANITATYKILDDRKIEVINQCEKSTNQIKRSKGTAKVVEKSGNAKLKVTFFWPFSGDYWILDLGEKYEYAVVGEPSRKYLWVLSRTPQMDEGLYQKLLSRVTAQGFATQTIIKVLHNK